MTWGNLTYDTSGEWNFGFDKGGGFIRLDESSNDERYLADGKLISHLKSTTKYKTWIEDSVPEREFSLTAYGLPEPPGITFERRTPTYLWFLIGAAVCALLAAVFRWLYRRSAHQPATSSTA